MSPITDAHSRNTYSNVRVRCHNDTKHFLCADNDLCVVLPVAMSIFIIYFCNVTSLPQRVEQAAHTLFIFIIIYVQIICSHQFGWFIGDSSMHYLPSYSFTLPHYWIQPVTRTYSLVSTSHPHFDTSNCSLSVVGHVVVVHELYRTFGWPFCLDQCLAPSVRGAQKTENEEAVLSTSSQPHNQVVAVVPIVLCRSACS